MKEEVETCLELIVKSFQENDLKLWELRAAQEYAKLLPSDSDIEQTVILLRALSTTWKGLEDSNSYSFVEELCNRLERTLEEVPLEELQSVESELSKKD